MTVAQHPAGRSRLGNHFRHHVLFYAATLAGLLVGLVGTEVPPAERLALAVNVAASAVH